MYPELGFHETRTSHKVAEILEGLGYRVRRGIARTGVIAELGDGKPVIAIRADMDALPLQEVNETSYCSRVPGLMHACGHDAHTAIALGVATLLKKEEFSGTVRFIFQPSEDSDDDDGVSGAPRMISEGALENVDAILGLHVHAGGDSGRISMWPGCFLAGADLFTASIIGKGGHGGMPHETIDPIYIAGQVILAINAIVSRRLPACESSVISLGSIHGGNTDTIIPEHIEISGTTRYMDFDVRKTIIEELHKSFAISKTLGGNYILNVKAGSPPTINDVRITNLVLNVTKELFGDNQIEISKPIMAGDDFAHYAKLVPAGYFFLGCRIEGDIRRHHDPRFDIDESCLPIGMAVMAETALRLLNGEIEKRAIR